MGNDTILIIVLGILIMFSAYFSATETAFSTTNKIRLKSMANNGKKKAKLVLDMSENYDKLLSTILIGNNIVNIASASLATVIFTKAYGDAGVTISTAVMTVLVLIFGEISPKSLAKEAPEEFAMFSAPFLNFLTIVLAPLNFIFALWKKMLYKMIKIKSTGGITEEELITIVEEATQEGGIEEHEGELIRSAIEFNDLNVGDILTPRISVVAVDENDSFEEIRNLFIESEYSRLPVYRDTIDNIIGVIHLKDFFNLTDKNIQSIIKPMVFTVDTVKISKLLTLLLQSHKSHLAVVTDEHGGTLGIVSLEDIIEELIGEIWDEHDDVIKEIDKITDTEYSVQGVASLDKLFRELSIEEIDDIATVNGWVLKELGRLPEIGDSFSYQNLNVKVLAVESRMVQHIKIDVLPRQEQDEEEIG